MIGAIFFQLVIALWIGWPEKRTAQ
jgi:hypothetical protein